MPTEKAFVKGHGPVNNNSVGSEFLVKNGSEFPPRLLMLVGYTGVYIGSEFPPLEPGKLRIYSMRLCPYAQRTRLLLTHKNIPFETINIHLKNKPDWFIERNPQAVVPVLEQDGKIVYESAVCNEYLEDIYPNPRCTPTDPYQLARDKMLVARSGKFVTNYYKALRGTMENEDDLGKSLDIIEEDLKGRGKFFSGENVGNLDFLLWPWMERLDALEKLGGFKVTSDRFPRLTAWIADMYTVPAVKKIAFDTETHLGFYRSAKEGNPNYDYGLTEASN